jgi:hypothetical protein
MSKFLRITMPDGSLWDVPAEIIAENRAEYYEEDGYDEEFQYTLDDDSVLIDWAANNMDWVDVKDHAVQVVSPDVEVNFQEGWMNGNKEVVNKEI